MLNIADIAISLTQLCTKWQHEHHQVYDKDAQYVLDHYQLIGNSSYRKHSSHSEALAFWNPAHPDRKYYILVEQLIYRGIYRLTCENSPKTEVTVSPEIATYEDDSMRFVMIAVLRMASEINRKYDEVEAR